MIKKVTFAMALSLIGLSSMADKTLKPEDFKHKKFYQDAMRHMENVAKLEKEKLSAAPTFEACGLYFKTDDANSTYKTEFRKKGSDKWKKAFDMVYVEIDGVLRGSIVNLKENTEYEAKLTRTKDGSKEEFKTEFKTWTLDVPIKKTVNLKDIPFNGYLEITDKGTKNGWIKYTAEKGFKLKGGTEKKPAILLKEAEYVILENLTIEGGNRHAINILDSKNIRIINCDISGFGRLGKQDLTKDGKYYMPDGRIVNMDGGINIKNSGNTLIERCYIHDPRSHANAWKYSHPAGPEAITVRGTGGVVLRYNDFIGSDQHRWNDAVESEGNGYFTGGLYKDSDVYGNMFAFGNDDGIELDGGQVNIRVWQNKFEGFLCGISTAPCLLGPSYSFRNLITNLGDEDGKSNTGFKNGHQFYGLGQIFFFNNTIYGNSNGYGNYGGNGKPSRNDKRLKGTARNNIYNTKRLISQSILRRKNDFDYDIFWSGRPDDDLEIKLDMNLKGQEKNGIFGKPEYVDVQAGNFALKDKSKGIDQGTVIDNFVDIFEGKAPDIGAYEKGKDTPLPYRPIPVFLNKYQLNFEAEQGKQANAQTVKANVKSDKEFTQKFKIRKNNVFDWFSVEPSEGELKNGDKIEFKVTLNTEKIKEAKLYRGLFLLRFENGYSRPVTVYAKVRGNVNIKKKGKGFTLYIEAENPSEEKAFKEQEDKYASENKCVFFLPENLRELGTSSQSYEFDVPKSGNYYIFARVKSNEPVGSSDSFFISIDGEEPKPIHLRSATTWIWSGVSRDSGSMKYYELLKLEKGKHSIKIFPREPVYVDMFLITDEPTLVY
jgi:hypothetical protein